MGVLHCGGTHKGSAVFRDDFMESNFRKLNTFNSPKNQDCIKTSCKFGQVE